VTVLKLLLRWSSYLFHLALALFLFGLAAFATLEGAHNLSLAMLPWTGKALTQWLLYGNLAGIAAILLAITGKFRYLYPVWSLIVLAMMVRGFFLSSYSFDGSEHFQQAVCLTAAALAAFLGSLTVFGSQKKKR